MRTDRPSYGSMVELGWMLVMQMVIPLREPPSELIITVLESSGSTVMEPGNGATTYKNVKYCIKQPTEMSTTTYNKSYRNVNYCIQQNLQKCQLLYTTKPTEMSTIVYNNPQKCQLLHTTTYRNVNFYIQQNLQQCQL